jgi:hypothetical protein
LKNPTDQKQLPIKYIGEIKRNMRKARRSTLASHAAALISRTKGIRNISTG